MLDNTSFAIVIAILTAAALGLQWLFDKYGVK